MKRSDLAIIGSVLVVALVFAFWFLVLGPKRDRAASLDTDIEGLRTSVQQAQDAAAYAQEAQQSFSENYHSVVVLGKAVPADADTPSLLVSLQSLADSSRVDFGSIDLANAQTTTPAVTTPPPLTSGTAPSTTPSTSPPESAAPGSTPTTPTSTSTPTTSSASAAVQQSESGATTLPAETSSAPVTALATEAGAAALPIGAVVGPAGLPTMPYDMKFNGGFFEIADFLKGVDGFVHLKGGRLQPYGRLMTVDGFSLSPQDTQAAAQGPVSGAALTVELAVTTYLTPPNQGLTAGATPSSPPAAVPTPASQPVSSSPTTSEPAATTSTTPTP